MMCACGEEEAKLAHLLYDVDPWDANGQACDDFDDDDDDSLDIEIDLDYFWFLHEWKGEKWHKIL